MRDLSIGNFRDVSGYQNRYGEVLKKNKIFRGAALDHITKEDAIYLQEELGIRYILDYRDEKEALMSPDISLPNATYERISALRVKNARNEGFDFGSMLQGEMTQEKINLLLEYVKEGYKTMAFDNPAYRKLFELLLRNDGHVYFHCTAGKDRTGVSAFLIMLALGMREEDCIKEYLLSNEFLKEFNKSIAKKLQIPQELKEISQPLLYVQREFIMFTIEAIQEKYPDYDTFLEKEYHLDEVKRKKLREIYCE